MKIIFTALISIIISSAATYYYMFNGYGVVSLISIKANKINHETYIRLLKEGKTDRLVAVLEESIYCESKNYEQLSIDLYGEDNPDTLRYLEGVKQYSEAGKNCGLATR